MDSLSSGQNNLVSWDEARLTTCRQELIERIARARPTDGTCEPISGLHLNRLSMSAELVHGVSIPAFCVIAQGAKEVFLGDDRYRYDPFRYLLAAVQLPIVSCVVEATSAKPYLSLRLDLDPVMVASVMLETGMPSLGAGSVNVRALDVSPLDVNLLDSAVRLVRLLDAPASDVRVLLPLLKREIVYRLLAGDQGARLRQIAIFGGQTDRIARAIEHLRKEFDQPLRIETLAKELGMSASGFHEQFKAVTALSPLQFQKKLRLQEARRLMLGESLDASSAAFRVGYEDTSHFSREYKRHFGQPPIRDIERLKESAVHVG